MKRTTMKAATIRHYGDSHVHVGLAPMPEVGPNDVLVRVYAASMNPIDFKIRDGAVKLLLDYDMPLILGNDFSGVIEAVGPLVTDWAVGDEVYGRPSKERIGTFAEYLATDASNIARKPSNVSFQEAAALPLVALTSYQALHDIMNIQPDDRVLIQAGSGGIGTIAIQIAKQLGAYVATTTSTKNADFVRSLGADRVIDYKKEAFDNVLNDYDYVFDTLGGDQLRRAFPVVKRGGAIVSISDKPNGRFAEENDLPVWKKALFSVATWPLARLERTYGVTYHFLFMKPSGSQLDLIRQWVEDGAIKPVIDRTYPLEAIQEAFDASERGHARGKLIIELPIVKRVKTKL